MLPWYRDGQHPKLWHFYLDTLSSCPKLLDLAHFSLSSEIKVTERLVLLDVLH